MNKKDQEETKVTVTQTRLLAIIQLCLAFSLILWYSTQPFMGEYFALRSRMLLYEYVMGISSKLNGQEENKERLQFNKERFLLLPETQRMSLQKDYQQLEAHITRPTLIKIKEGLKSLLIDIPAFEMAWLLFSVLTSIFLLLKKEGSQQAAWLLPLIVFVYSVDNQFNGKIISPSADLALFPSEAIIVREYLHEPLSAHWAEQRKQLQKGWERYLVQHWADDKKPQGQSQQKLEQQKIDQAEFNFIVARLQKLHAAHLKDWLLNFNGRLSQFQLSLYFFWNLFFAWAVSRRDFLKHDKQDFQEPNPLEIAKYACKKEKSKVV